MHDMFQYQKVSAQVVSKCLRTNWSSWSAVSWKWLNTLHRAKHSWTRLLQFMSWINHYILESNQASTEWKHATSPTKKKLRQDRPQERSCSLSLTSMPNWLHWAWDIIIWDSYCAMLAKLKLQIKGKCPGLLTDCIILLHNNAHPHLTLPIIFHRPMVAPESGDAMLYVQVSH
jgi:hypothetical protein